MKGGVYMFSKALVLKERPVNSDFKANSEVCKACMFKDSFCGQKSDKNCKK